MCALDEEQSATLLRIAEGTRMYVPVLVAVTTGLRRGELLALQWRDLDLEAATLTVNRSLEQTKAGLAFKSPKTEKARRTITLAHVTVDALRRHHAQQLRTRLALGEEYNDQGLVFPRSDGQPWKPSLLTDAFWYVIRRSNLPIRRFHDLRHTHASQLLRQGIHPKVVSERLGHSSIVITLNTYSHLLRGLQEEVASKVDASLGVLLRKPSEDDKISELVAAPLGG
jgi:integrase